MDYLKHPEQVVEKIRNGDQRAAGRLITFVENETNGYSEVMKHIYPHTGHGVVLGITGPGGAGKSTLINHLIKAYRLQGKKVGAVLVDPTSPFSGGALLGDRIRLQEHALDKGVFIRSAASRGNPGGLAMATHNIVRILKAMGMDVIIVETLGTGQDEIDIKFIAQTCLLLFTPGMGDEIQALKAGIIEIADILVLNKADMEGSDVCLMNLQKAVTMESPELNQWVPRVVPTVSVSNHPSKVQGINTLMTLIDDHQQYLKTPDSRHHKLTESIAHELDLILTDELKKIIIKDLKQKDEFKAYVQSIVSGEKNPYEIADEVLNRYLIL
jgi:LAO/AO transport system kinase